MRNLILGIIVLACSILGALTIMATSAPQADSVPVGTIIAWAGDTQSAPADWMLCNGKVLRRSQYPELFQAIGTAWGAPNAKRFNLPDLRGRFIRGADGGSKRDPDADNREASKKGGNTREVGSVQEDSFQNHAHNEKGHKHNYDRIWPTSGAMLALGSDRFINWQWDFPTEETESAKAGIQGAVKYGTKSSLKNGEETRPTNAAVNFIIKVK